MKILAMKPGHDGAIALIEDGRLCVSLEGEKDSFPRFSALHVPLFFSSMQELDGLPDVIATGGWPRADSDLPLPDAAGYFGTDPASVIQKQVRVWGKDCTYFSSSHERSHIACARGMAALPEDQPCYVLVWEGALGHFYRMDERGRITCLGSPLSLPGRRYVFLYHLGCQRLEKSLTAGAGKLMALAAFSDKKSASGSEQAIIDRIFTTERLKPQHTIDFQQTPYYRVGVETPQFKDLARLFSDQLFDRFYGFARRYLTDRLPLLIAGGCGLNCEWNARWRETGLFADVFIPPCANDSGSAIGTAIDAQWHLTGKWNIAWSVYSGQKFQHDATPGARYLQRQLDFRHLAELIEKHGIICWVQGRCEIGPRALGNRSILASPLEACMHERLNGIKKREAYRPIAPVCMAEDASRLFEGHLPSPFMLEVHRLKTDRLPAVTHVDRTGRLQTVSKQQNPRLHSLLEEFKRRTGYGVLCNTSLNFSGCGFINRMSDLLSFVETHNIRCFVVDDAAYIDSQSN